MTPTSPLHPVASSERHVILDVLRGIALFGICLANFGEFSLYTFLPAEATAAMPTAAADRTARFLQYLLVDGKFYTLFSVLFGIGFSLILSNAARRGADGMRLFYRRMTGLLLIGLCHLLLLWAGDILMLYAVAGMFLPLFWKASDRRLLTWTVVLLLVPILIDGCVDLFRLHLSAPAVAATQYFHRQAGITDANFPVWLAEKQHYREVLQFNLAGAFIRLQEFIDGHRIFKVFALFLLGLYIGRRQLYARLDEHKRLLKQVARYGALVGLPTSLLYAWEATHAHPLGLAAHSAIYAVSVVPLSLAYAAAVCLCYMKARRAKLFTLLAAPGRMALTNYLMQSVFGIILFYGIGWQWGARTGYVCVELIAVGVFLLQAAYSNGWLRLFRYGPLEWAWRMITYGKPLKLLK
jgi:uncharacterized protein